jgi:hypothetical protein
LPRDRGYILPVARDSVRINPRKLLFAAPGRPPGWKQSGGSILGNAMRKKISRRLCRYFVRFIEAYKAGAVPVRAVSSQNEVDIQLGRRCQARLEGQAEKPKRSIMGYSLTTRRLCAAMRGDRYHKHTPRY